jgi:hypothetical protein
MTVFDPTVSGLRQKDPELLGTLGNSWEGPGIVRKYPMDFWMGGMWPFLDCARRTPLPSTRGTLIYASNCVRTRVLNYITNFSDILTGTYIES